MLLFYIRHGDPTYLPDALTPLGRRQAEAIGRRLAQYGVDRIFASTSNRAVKTAKPVCEIMKKELTKLDFCHESHAWNELALKDENGERHWAMDIPKYRQLFSSPEVIRLGKDWHGHPAFADTRFEEGIQRISRETDRLMASLGYVHDQTKNCYYGQAPNEERVALFAHQGFGLAFLSCLLDIPYPQMCTRFDMGHTGMTVIEFQQVGEIYLPRVLMLAADGHLYRDGLPTCYQNRLRF